VGGSLGPFNDVVVAFGSSAALLEVGGADAGVSESVLGDDVEVALVG
jgi:hypothetical protein